MAMLRQSRAIYKRAATWRLDIHSKDASPTTTTSTTHIPNPTTASAVPTVPSRNLAALAGLNLLCTDTATARTSLSTAITDVPRRHLHRFSRPNLHVIRNQLAQFEGGSVDLEMNDDNGIAILTLNNPRRMNSMTGKMMVDMADRVSELEEWETGKALIMRGADGNLCTGGDLTFVRKALHYGDEMAAYQHDTLTRLLNLPLISVALVQGHTLGGGAELSTACDFRVMSPAAKIGFVQIKMGLTTAWGAATRLTRLLGRRKAIDLLCSAKILLPDAALREGLVDFVLPSCGDELEETTQWLLRNLCAYDTTITRVVKSLVVSAELSMDHYQALDAERRLFSTTWGGPLQRKMLEAKIKHK